MDELDERLFEIEAELAGGGGDAYRRHLAADALIVVPGAALDTDATIAAMDESPGWDEFELDRRHARRLSDAACLLSYRFAGRRDDVRYSAEMSSLYARDDRGEWKLLHHQQTPIEGP